MPKRYLCLTLILCLLLASASLLSGCGSLKPALSSLDDDKLLDTIEKLGVDLSASSYGDQANADLVRMYVTAFEQDPDYCFGVSSYSLPTAVQHKIRKAVKLYYGKITRKQFNLPDLATLDDEALLAELASLGVEFSDQLKAEEGFYGYLRDMVKSCEYDPDGGFYYLGNFDDPIQNETAIAAIYGDSYRAILNAVRSYHCMAPITDWEEHDGGVATPIHRHNLGQLESDPTAELTYNNVLSRFGTDGAVRKRETYFTPLANAMVGTPKDDVTYYFLVYATDPEAYPPVYDSDAQAQFVYNGMTVADIQAAAVPEGDPDYDQHRELLTAALAEYYFSTHAEEIAEYVAYFEKMGFEITTDLSDPQVRMRLYTAGQIAYWPIMFGAAGTLDDIWRAVMNNNDYCIMMYASDTEGNWFAHNGTADRLPTNMELTPLSEWQQKYIYTTCQQPGLYEDIWYKK